jgi:hypothetical protein
MSKISKKFNENYHVKKTHQPHYLIAYVKNIKKINENYNVKKTHQPHYLIAYVKKIE